MGQKKNKYTAKHEKDLKSPKKRKSSTSKKSATKSKSVTKRKNSTAGKGKSPVVNKKKVATKKAVTRKTPTANKTPQNAPIQTRGDDADLWEILYNPENFVKQFLALPYRRQIDMVVLLNHISKNYKPKNKLEKIFSDTAEYHLNCIHKLTRSSYDRGDYSPISDDEKKLIRMECHGSITKRLPHQLSPLYKYFMDTDIKKASSRKKRFNLNQYDLMSSPSWRVFNQFESFRKIAAKIKRYLYESDVNPDVLKVMTVSDFCDTIYHTFEKNNNGYTTFFTAPGDTLKRQYIKEVMKSCGKSLEKMLLRKKIDPRAVKSLCNAMRRFGVCDVNSLIVTETNFTDRVVYDLNRAGYKISKSKIGKKIPQTFVDKLIDTNNAHLILARDNRGNPIGPEGLPILEIHHKNAVKFSANGEYLAKSNYPDNWILTESNMHALYYHQFDRIVKQNKTRTYYSRLNVNCPQMCVIIGFSANDMLFCDLEKSRAFQRREAEDKAAVVNYVDMMEQRLINEKMIAEKYNLEYSEKDSSKDYNSLKELSGKVNLDKDRLRVFQAWLNNKSAKGK